MLFDLWFLSRQTNKKKVTFLLGTGAREAEAENVGGIRVVQVWNFGNFLNTL